jgi:hypothetical protein
MSCQRMTCAEATLRSMVDAGADRLFDMPGRGVYPLLRVASATDHNRTTRISACSNGRWLCTDSWSGSIPGLYMSTGV